MHMKNLIETALFVLTEKMTRKGFKNALSKESKLEEVINFIENNPQHVYIYAAVVDGNTKIFDYILSSTDYFNEVKNSLSLASVINGRGGTQSEKEILYKLKKLYDKINITEHEINYVSDSAILSAVNRGLYTVYKFLASKNTVDIYVTYKLKPSVKSSLDLPKDATLKDFAYSLSKRKTNNKGVLKIYNEL